MVLKCAGVLTLILIAGACDAAPVLLGDKSDARCIETERMARTAFRSTNPSLLWPVAAPEGQQTELILTQGSEDISGGGGISASSAFVSSGGDQGRPTIFWRNDKRAGPHLAVVDQPFSWRGDWYAVYLLPPKATAGWLLGVLTDERSTEAPTPLLGENRWAIPLVLRNRKTGRDWLIDRGEPYQPLADWQVYEPAGPHLRPICRVSFGVPKEEPLSLLPAAVRRFAAAADEALGPGNDEGTLQPTATIRMMIQKDWANAALRPWAITNMPYNTRAEIDRGLSEWARGNGKRRTLRARIIRSERAAQGPLATYYAAHLGKSGPAALRLSRYVLDHNFRSYFAFPKSK